MNWFQSQNLPILFLSTLELPFEQTKKKVRKEVKVKQACFKD